MCVEETIYFNILKQQKYQDFRQLAIIQIEVLHNEKTRRETQ